MPRTTLNHWLNCRSSSLNELAFCPASYKSVGVWVFDDPKVGIVQKEFSIQKEREARGDSFSVRSF